MNIYGDGPLYDEERPFYYDPGPEDMGMEIKHDERNLMIKSLILSILAPVLAIVLILAAIFVGISTIFKR